MAEKKKPKKPSSEGGSLKAGKGGSWLFWPLLLVAIVLVYALSVVPAAVLLDKWPVGRSKVAYRSVLEVVYWPVGYLATHCEPVGNAYRWMFSCCGIRN